MRRQDQLRCGLLVALLLTIPAVTRAEPILRLTEGGFIIDFSEPLPFRGEASGPNGSLNFTGSWRFTSNPTVGEGFVDPSYSGVSHEDLENEFGGVELSLGDRLLQTTTPPSFTFNISVLGAPVLLPPLDDVAFVSFSYPATFRGSLAGVFEDLGTGEQVELSVGLTGRGVGRMSFDKSDDGLHRSADIGFVFQEAAPVPEPSTLLLLSAAGVATVARRRSLRSR